MPVAKEQASQRVYEEIKSEEWAKARAVVKEELKEELMPALREEATEKTQADLRKQIEDEIWAKVKGDNEKNCSQPGCPESCGQGLIVVEK